MIPQYASVIGKKLGISEKRYYELGDEFYLDMKDTLNKELFEEDKGLKTTEMMDLAMKNCKTDQEACLMVSLIYPVSERIVHEMAKEKAMGTIAELKDTLAKLSKGPKIKKDESGH